MVWYIKCMFKWSIVIYRCNEIIEIIKVYIEVSMN